MRPAHIYIRFIVPFFLQQIAFCFSDHPEFEISSNSDVSYLFTNKYTKVFSYEFNDCMFQVESNNTKYHTCESFDSEAECQCQYLQDVVALCSPIGESETNYWYLGDEIKKYCKSSKNTDSSNYLGRRKRAFEIDSKQHVAQAPQNYDSQPKKTVGNDRQRQLAVGDYRQIHGISPELEKKYGKDFLATMDFEKYYNKKNPSAMTIDFDLMSALGLTATPTNLVMTKYTTTVAIHSASKTHHTQLEVIRVLEDHSPHSNHKRDLALLRTNTTSENTISANVSAACTSQASTVNSSSFMLTFLTSVSLALLIWPFITPEEDAPLSQSTTVTSGKHSKKLPKKRIHSATYYDMSNKRICSK